MTKLLRLPAPANRSLAAVPDLPAAPLVCVQPHPLKSEHQVIVCALGSSLADIVRTSGIAPQHQHRVRVWVNGWEAPREHWVRLKPRAGTVVHVVAHPANDDFVRVLGVVAIIAVSIWVGPVATSWAAKAGFAAEAASAIGAAASLGVSMLGQMALNAIVPPARPSLAAAASNPQSAPTYQLTSSSNRYAPYAPIPRVLGRARVYPLHAARPWTEVVGDDQYLRLLLLVGYGPLRLSDWRIGTTPLSSFADVQMQVNEGGPPGWSGNAATSLYTSDIYEDGINVALEKEVWVTRTTQANCVGISVDVQFPRGLAHYKDDGSRENHSAWVTVNYRLVGATHWEWPTPTPDLSATENTTSSFSRSMHWNVPQGQYEVRIKRQAYAGHEGDRYLDDTRWSVLRSYQLGAPVLQPRVCLVALRIRATAQLNGTPDSINCLAESYLPVWNGSAWSWQISRSPAWGALHLMRERGDKLLLADARLDLSAWRDFDTACAATPPNGAAPYWTYDGVIEGGSVGSAVTQILSHGRASPTQRDGKYSVVLDAAQTVPVQHITPANSWGYTGSKRFVDLPHGLKVKFRNAAKDYAVDEITVYADGYNAANVTLFESAEYYGFDNAQAAWRMGRYLLAVGQLRPEEHVVNMDIESLRCTRGDLVQLAHDVILVGLGYGRVRAQVTAGGSVTGLVLDGTVVLQAGQSYALRVRLSNALSQVLSLAAVSSDIETDTVSLATALPLASSPVPGDLYLFGKSGQESAGYIVTKVEPGQDLSAKLTLVDAAPAVLSADSGSIPAFDTHITVPVGINQLRPAAPSFTLRSDETALAVSADGSLQERIAVDLLPPQSSGVAVGRREVQYCVHGATVWLSGGAGLDATLYCAPVNALTYYDVRVRNVSVYGVAGDWAQVSNHMVVGKTAPPANVANLALTIANNGLLATWGNPTDVDYDHTELSWTADFTQRESEKTTAHLFGWRTAGTHTLYARHVDTSGNVSLAVASVSLVIRPPASVNVLRRDMTLNTLAFAWGDAKTDQPILRYEYRYGKVGTALDDALYYGSTGSDGRSDIMRFPSAGDKVVYVTAFDLAGNASTPTSFTVTSQLPVDFVLSNSWDATWDDSELVNALIVGGAYGNILLPYNTGRTWGQRLSNYGWTTAQQKVSAGYPIVIQPTALSGSHAEEHDLGKVVPSAQIIVTPTYTVLAGNNKTHVQIYYKTAPADAWTTPGLDVFATTALDVRYVRVVFSAESDGHDLFELANLAVEVKSQEVTEFANVTLVATDAGGTLYTPAKTFLDIRSVTMTPKSPAPKSWYWAADDSGATPRVLLWAYDANNNRVGDDFSIQIGGY